MKPLSCDEFTAFIGIDWADRKHDICLQGAHRERREFARIKHKVDAIDQWAISIRQRLAQEVELGVERVEVFGRKGLGPSWGWSGWSRRVPGTRIE